MSFPMEPVEAEVFANLHYTRLLEKVPVPGCEFNHVATVCTRTVTHRVSSCREQANVCQAGRASFDQTLAEEPEKPCQACRRPTRECWSIRSI